MSIVGRLYMRLRGRELDASVPARVTREFVRRKGLEAVRGLPLSLSGGRKGLRFRGSGVSLRHREFITIGPGVAVGNDTTIDGFGRQGITIGANVTIGPGTEIRASGVIAEPGEGVRIGDRTAIGARNVIWGQGGISIGENCLLGPNVTILSENHVADSSTELIREQGAARDAVVIEDDCWIGAGATVLLGVRIGRGAVVGAGAVVTKDVASLAIVAGVPAKQIGQRGRSSVSVEPSES